MTAASINQQNTFVIDTSFVLAYLLPDEEERVVESMFTKFEENKIFFISPYLLIFETLNGLRSAVLQKRQTAKTAENFVDAFLDMGIFFEQINEKEVLRLAIKKSISVYDASYLWMAKSRKLKLLTLDEKLVEMM